MLELAVTLAGAMIGGVVFMLLPEYWRGFVLIAIIAFVLAYAAFSLIT